MEVHYAPRTPAVRFEPGETVQEPSPGLRVAVLAVGRDRVEAPAASPFVQLPGVESAMRGLYDALHRLDDAGVERIVVLMPPDAPEWSAVRDRLRRATVRPGGA